MADSSQALPKTLSALFARWAVKALAGRWAFLGIGPVGWAITLVVQMVLEHWFQKAFLDVKVRIDDKEVDQEVKTFNEVFERIKGQDVKKLTQEELDELEKEAIAAARNLIRY